MVFAGAESVVAELNAGLGTRRSQSSRMRMGLYYVKQVHASLLVWMVGVYQLLRPIRTGSASAPSAIRLR